MVNTQLGAVVRHLRRLRTLEAGAGTDAELIAAFSARNDQAAFAGLVERYAPLVLGVCRRVLRQEQDAEDAFQATFLVLAHKAASRVDDMVCKPRQTKSPCDTCAGPWRSPAGVSKIP